MHTSPRHDRGGELKDAIQQGTAVVAESEGQIKAYASSIAFSGHAVGEANRDLQALIAAAKEFQGPGILVPTRNAGLLRWCLESGLRVVHPMTLMTTGLYNEPRGAFAIYFVLVQYLGLGKLGMEFRAVCIHSA